MLMKPYIIRLLFLLFISTQLFSQERENRKKVQALKVSYISNQLELTAQEAEKFWPIYNTFDSKRKELLQRKRNKLKKEITAKGGIDAITEKEAKLFTEKMMAIETSYHKENMEYQKSLAKVLKYKKILKLQLVERDFTRRMFSRLRKDKREKKRDK